MPFATAAKRNVRLAVAAPISIHTHSRHQTSENPQSGQMPQPYNLEIVGRI
ncbi:hypothetical protein [uncultured Duncaniella sp.]|uniref:hypothetical protein n=1 Tax=uncultured Duncaniella sp. TaxID=2768039 RepID=UPI0026176BF2|nr:hypothetical protein [uncultured Duncaniella sp.]